VYHAYPNAGYTGSAVIGLCTSMRFDVVKIEAPCMRRRMVRNGKRAVCIKPAWWRARHLLSLLQRKDKGNRWVEQTGVATSKI
jgi:hypothetical protein